MESDLTTWIFILQRYESESAEEEEDCTVLSTFKMKCASDVEFFLRNLFPQYEWVYSNPLFNGYKDGKKIYEVAPLYQE